jgi:hypothetical protein
MFFSANAYKMLQIRQLRFVVQSYRRGQAHVPAPQGNHTKGCPDKKYWKFDLEVKWLNWYK